MKRTSRGQDEAVLGTRALLPASRRKLALGGDEVNLVRVIVVAFPRRIFNKVCGWCHAGMSGRELDVSVSLDVLTTASISLATSSEAIDLVRPPGERAAPEGP